jgi:FKBP-type peptidyl-prolyl cis-trans isomerase FkpA
MKKQYLALLILAGFMSLFSCKKKDNTLSAAEEDALIKAFIAKKGWTAQTTPEGIYYVTDSVGTGVNPTVDSYVSMNYKGYVLDVTAPFDASAAGKPIEFRLGNVIDGLKFGLQKFKVGGKGKIIMPSAAGFGIDATRGVPANSILVFDFDIATIKTQAVAEDDNIKAFIAKKGWTAQRTPEGVYYVIDSVGTGTTMPTLTSVVKVFYKGYLMDDKETVFDSNLAPKSPIEFTLSSLIQGWQIGFQKFKAGGKGKLIIPSTYGYGAQGSNSIAPYTILVFDVELVSFK